MTTALGSWSRRAQLPPRRDGRGDVLFDYLGLSRHQRRAWVSAHRRHALVIGPLFEQIGRLRGQIRAELESERPDAAALGNRLISIQELEGDLEVSRAVLEITLRGLLDEDQRRRYEAFMTVGGATSGSPSAQRNNGSSLDASDAGG